MFRTRFWPMTARPISPMSQLSFCIGSFYLRAMRGPLGRTLLPKGPDPLGEIGRAEQLLTRLSSYPAGALPIKAARFGDEAETLAQSFRAGSGNRLGQLLRLGGGRYPMRQTDRHSFPRVDDPASDAK